MTLKYHGCYWGLVLWSAMAGSVAASCGGSSPGGAGTDGGLLEAGPVLPQGGGGIAGGDAPLGGGGSFIGTGGVGGGTVTPCGEPGTQCCGGTNCSNGACCVSGICLAVGGACVGLGDGLCNAGACGLCGGLGLPCCTSSAGSVCTAPDTRCTAGTCARCGQLGDTCCPNPAGGTGICMGAGAICSNNNCIVCGTPGAACCPGNLCTTGCCYNNTCLSEGAACGSTGGNCQAGRCSGCGSVTQTCCANLCYDGLLCKSGTCAACGGSGQTCCPAGGSLPQCQNGMACTSTSSDGICALCGRPGDICCDGSRCGDDGCCVNGRCNAVSTGVCPGRDAGTDAPVGVGGATGQGGITGAGGVSGRGGATGVGGIIGTGGATAADPCGPLIDDMESGTGNICQTTGRRGMWYTYVDDDIDSSITPLPESSVLPELMSTPRTEISTRAMHISGIYTTYAGLACWLNIASRDSIPGTYNGSSYTGIRFYAKGKGSLIVVGQMPATEKVIYGGTCTYSECAGNQYTVGTLSSSSWTLYTVPFTRLVDGTVEPFDPSKIWSLEFMFYSSTTSAASFDLWIDDLTFY